MTDQEATHLCQQAACPDHRRVEPAYANRRNFYVVSPAEDAKIVQKIQAITRDLTRPFNS